MIYEETYNFMLKNVSSVEFDVCLYSLLKTDWDGNIRASIKDIATKVGTSTKYMKEIVKRFTTNKRGRKVFLHRNDFDGDLFHFNISKTHNLGFNRTTDKYCKKYKFFYTKEFRELSINAKRLLLMGSFRMSVTKNETISIPVSAIVPHNREEGGLPFTKKRLREAINIIQLSPLVETVSISLVSNIFTKEESVHFDFKEGTLEEYLENDTEKYLLRKKMYLAGYQGYLDDDTCIEIEKVGSYIYRSFLRGDKENSKKRGVICDAKEDLLKLARFVYDTSIKRLANGLNVNADNYNLSEPKEVSAYFSKIVFDVVLEESSKYNHQADTLRTLIDVTQATMNRMNEKEKVELLDSINRKKEKNIHIAEVLTEWCEQWIISRVKSSSENKANVSKEKINKLKNSVYDKLDDLLVEIKERGNRLIKNNTIIQHLEQIRTSLSMYFLKVLNGQELQLKKHTRIIEIDEDILPF